MALTPAEKRELDSLLALEKKAPTGGGLSTVEQQELDSLMATEKGEPAETTERPGLLSELGEIGRGIKTGLGEAGEAFTRKDISLPSRIFQGVGELAGTATDVPLGILERGFGKLGITPALQKANIAAFEKLVPEKGKEALGAVGEKVSGFTEKHPELTGNIGAALDIAGVLPGVSAATKTVGKGLEKVGKKALRGELKVGKPLAKRAGGPGGVAAGEAKIIEDIQKFDLSSKKGFKDMVNKAETAIKNEKKIADDALAKVVNDLPDARISLDENFAGFVEDLRAGNIKGIPFDKVDDAADISSELADKIKKTLGKDTEFGVDLTLDEANRVRKLLSEKVFKKGAPGISDDPIRDQVKERLALKIRDAVGEFVPDQKVANRNIRDLINVKTALSEAELAAAKRHQFGLSDIIIGSSGFGAAGAAASPGTAAATLGILGGKQLAKSGRGASALLQAGKKLKKAPGLTEQSQFLKEFGQRRFGIR